MDHKLIIRIDGLGKDFISEEDTPFLYKFGKENYFAELETLFAFTGLEYSFFSGKSPEKSDVWLEFAKSESSIFKSFLLRFFSFNKKLRDYFAVALQKLNGRTWFSSLHNIPSDKLKFFDTCVKQGLWKLDFFQKRNFVFYKWPFFVVKKNDKEKEKIIFKYEGDRERMGRLAGGGKSDVYYTQLMRVDKVVHKFGKTSEETKQALKNMDKLIEEYVGRFFGENKEGNVFLWSDHGFADIKNYIDIEKVLPKQKDYVYFIAGTTVSFWFKDKKCGDEIKRIFKKIPNVKILDDKTAKKYKIPQSQKYGDLIFYVEKGNYFFPNFYQKSNKEKFVSMHGYPDDKELNGFLISNKKIPDKIKISEALKWIK